MLSLPVLVRGINNLSDARYCAGMGAAGLIFTLDPALPGAVTPELVRELAGWVAGVELIGEFGPTTPYAVINELVHSCGLSQVLLHYTEANDAAFFEPASLLVTVIVEVSPYYIFDAYAYKCLIEGLNEHFPVGYGLLTEARHFVAGQNLRHRGAEVALQLPLWLNGVSTSEAARQAVGLGVTGLILTGGDEIKPGLRDFTELEAVFEALEVE